MKKLLFIALTILLVVALTACNGDSAPEVADTNVPDLEEVDTGDEAPDAEDEASPPDPEYVDIDDDDYTLEDGADLSEPAEVDDGDDAPLSEAALAVLSFLEEPGLRIGVQNGTTGHIFAEANLPDAVVDAFPLFSDAVMALNAGSIDAIIIDSLPAAQFVTANEGAITMLDGYLTFEYYGIAFQHGSYLTALFDDAINQLRANGVFDEIYDYWINQTPGASRYVTPEGTEHPNGRLTMATSAGFPPFELFEGTTIVGFDPCLAQAIGDIIGYDIEVIDMLFDSIITGVQVGQYDFGMAGMTIREDRREFVDFSQGYFNSGQVILVRTP